MAYAISINWHEEWQNSPEKWINHGRDALIKNCKHHKQDKDSNDAEYGGYCDKCDISEDTAIPMMNFLYPLELKSFDESKENILNEFKALYEKQIRTALKSIGIIFKGFAYFSPNAYNYESDAIDLSISNRIDKALFRKAILEHKDEINEALSKNKSYDGYMALTTEGVEQELKDIEKPNYEPDILVLLTILDSLVDTSEFEYAEYFVYEELQECE